MPKPKVLALVIEDVWICPERPLDLDDPPGRGRFGQHGPEEATT
ncbi:MAG TPA: hypothetical protein VJ140_18385 [Actinomycetota bacterium]|nr:hypothetical protein [Actinomycetota bacterium]